MMKNNGTEVPGITHCTRCGLPAHASETNDAGVCGACLGDEAVRPDDDDAYCADEDAWRPGDGFAADGVDVESRFDFGAGDA